MKIKVAVLDKDTAYLNRFVGYFQEKYVDKVEVYAFTDDDSFLEFNEENVVNIILCDSKFETKYEPGSSRSAFIYFVDSDSMDSFNEQKAISKYQRMGLIYSELLGVASENVSNLVFRKSNTNVKAIAFTSPQGGGGASTVAAAFAMQKARMGFKVFYLSLEKLGNPEIFFDPENNATFSDVLFNIKSKKNNLIMKMESCIQHDASGVEFFRTCKNPFDMLEMSASEQEVLIKNIVNIKDYDYLVLDVDFSLDDGFKQIIMDFAELFVLVGDGSAVSNDKLVKSIEVFRIWEAKFNADIMGRVGLIYNRFSSSKGMQVEGLPIRTLGGTPRIESPAPRMIAQKISEMSVFQAI